MRGREGGTIDEMRASIWVAEQYRRIGLKPAGDDGTFFQWFDMTRTRVSVSGSMKLEPDTSRKSGRATVSLKPTRIWKSSAQTSRMMRVADRVG